MVTAFNYGAGSWISLFLSLVLGIDNVRLSVFFTANHNN